VVVRLPKRPREQQGPQREGDHTEHIRPQARVDPSLSQPSLKQRQHDRAEDHRDQPGSAMEKVEVAALEVDLNVARGQHAHGQCGEKGPYAGRRGDADALEDVEQQVHGALP
jgi:hypothetical protein